MNLTPEAEQELAKFKENANTIIHSQQTRDTVINRIKAEQDPFEGAIKMSLRLYKETEETSDEQDRRFNLMTMAAGMGYIVTEVVSIATEAGVLPIADEQKYGEVTEETIKRYLEGAFQAGRIEGHGFVKDVNAFMADADEEGYQKGLQLAQQYGVPA